MAVYHGSACMMALSFAGTMALSSAGADSPRTVTALAVMLLNCFFISLFSFMCCIL